MSDPRIDGYARALFEVARAEGNIDVVEDELHRFKVAFSGSDELRVALTDSQIPAAKRQAIIEDLLGGKANATTVQLVSMVVGAGRGRDLPLIIESLVSRASSAKGLEVAELETKAAAEVAAVGGRVGDELRAEIGRLSAAAVDQVVNGSLDTATHQALIEDFIANVGGSK